MYWYKVKSALILLFLAINIFLLSRIAYVSFSERQEEKTTLASVITLLQSDSVVVTEDSVPQKKVKLKALSVQNTLSDKAAFVKAFLGTNAINIPVPEEYAGKIPDTASMYSQGNKTLLLYGDKFIYNDSGAGNHVTPSEENINSCLSFLAEKGFYPNDISYTFDSSKIVFRLYPGGACLFDVNLTAVYGENGISSLSGNWASLTLSNDTVTTLSPAYNALIKFYRDPARPLKPVKINSIEAGYSIWLGDAPAEYKTAAAAPVWRIALSDGQNFYYDAR